MTSRSISRSALLISLLAAACGGPSAPAGSPRIDTPPQPAPSAQAADLLLVGGDVHTMDPANPHVTGIAIRDGKVIALGDEAQLARWQDASTRRIDLAGATVTPGLIDAHCHLYGLGVDGEAVSVRALPSEAETVKVVALAAKTRPPGEWLLGRGWDQNRWPGQKFPTKASLDAVLADRPVLLRRVDGHALWVNSKALAEAGITKATKDPAGGKIIRDAKGEPTGVLIDRAVELVDVKVPVATAEMRERRIRAAAQQAIAVGITGVHEMGIDDATADVFRKLAAANQLPLRVYAFYDGDATRPERLRTKPAPAVGRFVMRGVKFFADGALGSRGARLYKKYDDDGKNVGLWVTEPNVLAAGIEIAVAHGWQVAIHAIGDAAIGATLDGYLAALKAHPGDLRLRVEHAQVIAPEDIKKLIDARAVASMQPTHATSDMPWAEKRVGKDRIKGAYAWRTMLDQKIPLAFGSDFPVEEVAPLLGIYAAVTRQDAEGKPEGGWYAAQKLTLDEAIAAFTRDAAYAEFAEGTRGVLAVGRPADLTVFDGALQPDRSMLARKVSYTIVDGKIVFERGKQAQP